MKTELVQEVVENGLALAHSPRKSGEHSLKTEECPSIPEFERLAVPGARWTLRRLLHTNTCRYCQLNLALFRKELNIKPWWEVWQDQWQNTVERLFSLGWASAASPSKGGVVVPAVIVRKDAPRAETNVAIPIYEIEPSDYLWLHVTVPEAALQPADWPVELVIVDSLGEKPVCSFTLPRLPRHSLRTKLPTGVAGVAEAWPKNLQALRNTTVLPFRFVIRPADAKVEET